MSIIEYFKKNVEDDLKRPAVCHAASCEEDKIAETCRPAVEYPVEALRCLGSANEDELNQHLFRFLLYILEKEM